MFQTTKVAHRRVPRTASPARTRVLAVILHARDAKVLVIPEPAKEEQ